MQIDPITSTLKAPGSNRLKLGHNQLPSSVAFNFNFCRYTQSMAAIIDTLVTEVDVNGGAASVAAIMFAIADPMRRPHDVKMAGLRLRHTDQDLVGVSDLNPKP